jgi:hypothetical protein
LDDTELYGIVNEDEEQSDGEPDAKPSPPEPMNEEIKREDSGSKDVIWINSRVPQFYAS